MKLVRPIINLGAGVYISTSHHMQMTLPPFLPSLCLSLPLPLPLPLPPPLSLSLFLSPHSLSLSLTHTHAVLKHTPSSNRASQTIVSLSQLHLTPWRPAASVVLGDQRMQVQSTHHQCLPPDEHTPLKEKFNGLSPDKNSFEVHLSFSPTSLASLKKLRLSLNQRTL